VSLDQLLFLKLYLSRVQCDCVYSQVSFCVCEVEQVVGGVVGEGSDSTGGELENTIVLGFLEEDDLGVAVVETPDYD
jgi:hypothetical protein